MQTSVGCDIIVVDIAVGVAVPIGVVPAFVKQSRVIPPKKSFARQKSGRA